MWWEKVLDWFRMVYVMVVLNYKSIASTGWKHFINEGDPNKSEHPETIMLPFDKEIRNKKWVVIKDTGQVGVIDHIKSDGRLGVRPVDPLTAAYIPNLSKHWSWDDRIRIPHELALLPGKVRQAMDDEIPHIARK